jgi:hypothetical protein
MGRPWAARTRTRFSMTDILCSSAPDKAFSFFLGGVDDVVAPNESEYAVCPVLGDADFDGLFPCVCRGLFRVLFSLTLRVLALPLAGGREQPEPHVLLDGTCQ